jgi:hypothetical protein
VLHAMPVSFFSVWSPENFWVTSTYNLVPHYVLLSNPQYPLLSLTQILSSAPYSQTPSANVPSSMWASKLPPI